MSHRQLTSMANGEKSVPRLTRANTALAVALLLVALLLVAMRPAHAQGPAPRAASPLEQTVDADVRPGADFFAYANGAWLKATPLPQGKFRWGPREELSELARRRVLQLIDEGATSPAGSIANKVAAFRAAWLDERGIEARGLAPLQPLLDSIARINDHRTLAQMLGALTPADVDPLNWGVYRSSHLLGLSVEQSIHGETDYVAFLVQGGLGLGDRAAYLDTTSAARALRERYAQYLERLLTLTGAPDAARRASAVVTLETAIAATQATQATSANDRNADTVWSRTELARQAPGMDWATYLDAAGLSRADSIVPWQPSAVRGLAALVASQPVDAWKDLLRLHLLDHHAEVLPAEYANAASEMHALLPGASPRRDRATRALAATQAAMSDAIGTMYAHRWFPPGQKARVQSIIANVSAAFQRRLDALTWMSPKAKAVAHAKVAALYIGIGYPEREPSYGDVSIDPSDALGNMRRLEKRRRDAMIARVNAPVEHADWWVPPQTPQALLNFQQNSYEMSAALLQPPKFDPGASDAATYGAIGAVIGHDITHYVDLLGADYEVDGRMHRWWTEDDMTNYARLTAPLAEQYSSYRPFPDVAVNGKLSLSENVADLAGLSAAFDAHRAALGSRIHDAEYVRQRDREFFIAFAQAWRGRMTDSTMRVVAATSDHAPEQYRVATVRNLDAWYDAFDVKPGDPLYLAPGARIRIW